MSKVVRRRRAKKTSKRTGRSPRSSHAPLRVAMEALAGALKGQRWYLFGAQAVALHGFPRTTADIDVTVAVPAGGVRTLFAPLKRAGFELTEVGDVDAFIDQTYVLPFMHRNGVGLDVVLSASAIEDGAHERAQSVRLGRAVLHLIEINDLVTMKLFAGRPKDLEDVRALIRIAPKGLSRAVVAARLRDLERAIDVSDLVPRLDALWPC